MGQLAHDNNHVPVISTVGAGSARPMETKQITAVLCKMSTQQPTTLRPAISLLPIANELAHDKNRLPVISTVGAGSARPMETKQMK